MDPARSVDTDRLRRDIDATRVSIAETMGELRQKVGETMQWQTYVERHPAPFLVGAALAGLFLGRRLARTPTQWASGEAGTDPLVLSPVRFGTAGGDRLGAVSVSWQRLGSRVEALVNRVIDEVADATEQALVPALVSGVQALFEGRSAHGVHRPPPGTARS